MILKNVCSVSLEMCGKDTVWIIYMHAILILYKRYNSGSFRLFNLLTDIFTIYWKSA